MIRLSIPNNLPELEYKDACWYILNVYISKCDNEEYEFGDEIPINYKALVNIVGNDAAPALKELHAKGVLMRTRKKNTHLKQSARYTLAKAYHMAELVKCPARIGAALKRWHEHNRKELDSKFKGETRGLYDMRMAKLDDDYLWGIAEKRYAETLEDRRAKFRAKNAKRKKAGKEPLEWNDEVIKQSMFRAMKRSYVAVKEKEHCCKSDGRGNRLYNTYTNMPKEMVYEIRLEGRTILSFDISSCQIVGLYMWLRNMNREWWYFKTKYAIGGYWNADAIGAELDKMRDWLSRDLFYTMCEKMFPNLTRKRAKKYILTYLDGRRCQFKNPAFRFFQSEFPHIHSLLDKLKGDDYRFVAHMMEKMESVIVWDGLIPRIRSARREAGLKFTYLVKHDCISIPSYEPYTDLLRKEIKRYGEEQDIPLHWKEEHYTR